MSYIKVKPNDRTRYLEVATFRTLKNTLNLTIAKHKLGTIHRRRRNHPHRRLCQKTGHFAKVLVMRFEWDEAKNQANIRKHGIDFAEAVYVFSDPFALSIPDDDHSEHEEPWALLGKNLNERLL